MLSGGRSEVGWPEPERDKPKGAAILRDRLLVIDFGNHRGQIFDLDGKALGVFGEGILSPVPDTPVDRHVIPQGLRHGIPHPGLVV